MTFIGLDDLGLSVSGQRLEPDRAALDCGPWTRLRDPDVWCHSCGSLGRPIGTVNRRLAHTPFGWGPTILLVTVRRYRCTGCARIWRQDTSKAAESRQKLSRAALRWALEAIVCQHLSVARVAEALAVGWNCANDALLAEAHRALISDPTRFKGRERSRCR